MEKIFERIAEITKPTGVQKRKFKCTGCGESRPCFLETNQESNNIMDVIEDLKCVLDETNQTSYNWQEIKAK